MPSHQIVFIANWSEHRWSLVCLLLIQDFPCACASMRTPRHWDLICSIPKLKIFPNHKAKLIQLKSLDISKQRSTVFEGLEEFFCGNSRIISDCRACTCSILKTLSSCLYMLQCSRNFLKFVYWSWRSKWIVQPYLPCCNLQPLSRVISPLKSE